MNLEVITNNGTPTGMGILLHDALKFGIFDSLHPQNGYLRDMITFFRLDPNSSNRQKITSLVESYSDIMVWGNREDSVNHSIFVQGYEVQTNASDMRLKKNIKPSEDVAVDIINQIEIDSFDWRKPRHHKRKTVKFGYMAQRVREVLASLVDYDKLNDKYQMNLLNISALHTKGIQEISKENKLLWKIIKFLVTELGCKEKLEKYLKGEE